MNRQTFELELITPCFSGGAEPDQRAEIRAASIRGQLRWWFRVLGGFQSLSAPVRDQESLIFGSAAGDEGCSGALRLQVLQPVTSNARNNADDLNAGMNTPLGYALFPLRSYGENDGRRGVLSEGTTFSLALTWMGDSRYWQDIISLLIVWANLGSMGFRSRRTVGAVRLKKSPKPIDQALAAFKRPIRVSCLKESNANNWRAVSGELLEWYRSWRQHGQMNRTWKWNDKKDKRKGGEWIPIKDEQKQANRNQPGFRYARRDHNEGLSAQGTLPPNPDPENPHGKAEQTFRPALGLPIIQFFSSLGGQNGPISRNRATVNWEFDHDGGRFASPVILRPHKDDQGNWHALVIFVDALQWPKDKKVFLNGREREVSLDLYEAMKNDRALQPFL